MRAALLQATAGMESDSALQQRIASGDSSAFEQLMRRYTVPAGQSIDYRCTLHPTMTARIEVGAARKGK